MSECFCAATCSFRIPQDVMFSVFFFFFKPPNFSLRVKMHLFSPLSLYLHWFPFFQAQFYSWLELQDSVEENRSSSTQSNPFSVSVGISSFSSAGKRVTSLGFV